MASSTFFFPNIAGLMVIGCSIQTTEAWAWRARARFCPMYCLDFEYMTCNSTGTKQLPGVCNCCLAAQKGCTIHLRNGGVQKCP
uniref:Uncharacterized protein n=1 Tax=Saccharum hybrid cultivar R570 TaxID=131158 RepID=A0A059PYZ4_9POAL|nr:hypothetical protein SHCRBa_119_J13_R_330 [Saccharum hybrid cultivar R570]